MSHNGSQTAPTTYCPSWCTTPASVHALDDPGDPLHTTTIHGLSVGKLVGRPPTVCVENEELTAEQLRVLAATYLQVSDWLEAH